MNEDNPISEYKARSISVVFPAYNEEKNISKAVALAKTAVEHLTNNYEIIIINDGSTDHTKEIMDQLVESDHRIKVIHRATNGKNLGSVLRLGFEKATKDYILYSDADLPFDFNQLSNIVPFLEDKDFVTGYRLNRRVDGFRRYVYSIVYNALIRCLFSINVNDVNFSLKLFRKDILNKINLKSEGSFIDAELLIKAARNGFKIVQYPVYYRPRCNGKSTLSSLSVILKIFKELIEFKKTGK